MKSLFRKLKDLIINTIEKKWKYEPSPRPIRFTSGDLALLSIFNWREFAVVCIVESHKDFSDYVIIQYFGDLNDKMYRPGLIGSAPTNHFYYTFSELVNSEKFNVYPDLLMQIFSERYIFDFCNKYPPLVGYVNVFDIPAYDIVWINEQPVLIFKDILQKGKWYWYAETLQIRSTDNRQRREHGLYSTEEDAINGAYEYFKNRKGSSWVFGK